MYLCILHSETCINPGQVSDFMKERRLLYDGVPLIQTPTGQVCHNTVSIVCAIWRKRKPLATHLFSLLFL